APLALYVIDATLGPPFGAPVIATVAGLVLTQPALFGAGDTVADAVMTATPVPVNGTVSTELEALLLMVKAPVRVPAAVGVKVTSRVQGALPTVRVPVQVVEETVKSPVVP